MTIATDITTATTDIGLVVDFPTTKTALTALLAAITDINTALTAVTTTANAAATATALAAAVAAAATLSTTVGTHTTEIAANTAAIAANPYISLSQATGIQPAHVSQAPTAGATEDDPDLLISTPGRVSAASTADFALLVFSTAPTLPGGTHAVAYSKQLVAGGGSNTGITFQVVGTLPAGMTLSSAGLLAGTPTTAGTYVIVVTTIDSVGNQVSQAFTLVVA